MMVAGGRWALLTRRLLGAVPLLVGVTLVSFALTVHFGPDPSWELLGRNPTPEQIDQIQRQLGQDQPFLLRYGDYLLRLVRLDLGHSHDSGERVTALLARTVPVSLAVLGPGFVIGMILALALALGAAWRPQGRLDRCCRAISSVGMSLSLVITVIALQAVFAVWLDWFPVRGWAVDGIRSYLLHAAVPTMAMVAANLGYNLRFFRAVLVATLNEPPARTARAYGLPGSRVLTRYVLRAAMLPILTRVVFSVPLILISGSLVIESHFGIPGAGRITFEAVTSGNQPVLMAVVSLSAVLFVIALTAADLLARVVDPRIRTA